MKIADVTLASAVVLGIVVAACGGGGEGEKPPQVPTATPSGTGTQAPPTPTASSPSPTTSATPAMTPPAAKGPMKNIAPSAMLEDLKKIGLDPKNLPPLSKVDPEKLRLLMNTFKKSLGVQCNGCHDPNDMKAWTPNKRIASGMWNELVRKLTFEDGSPLYCDSCHQGSAELLDRKDKKALSAWMDANFVSKLKRADVDPKGRSKAAEHSCDTCHGDPFEPLFLAQWAKEKKK